MPKETFFNLPTEKQENLIRSAEKEFSRVPLYEASISNIVKAASIPRGSFYQYFEDKEDAFFYLLEQNTEASNERFISVLKKTEGDIFATFSNMFEIMLKDFNDPDNRSFFKNAFLNMNHKMESIFTEMFNESRVNKSFSEVRALMNTKTLNTSSEEEVAHVMQIIVVVTVHHLIRNFAREISFEEAVKSYELEMNLLKRGLYKEET